LHAETWDSAKELPAREETTKTENNSIPLLDTEDVPLAIETSCNAESTVDQTRMIRVLMLGLAAQVNHGYQNMSRLVVNSESLLKVGLKERVEMENGDH
jgi:hypothetical protein